MEQLRELQLKSLEMLLYFDKFCEENGLLYYFCGGCCIGTLRNGGFIPWDDDIDVFMPRTDFEKLKELWPEKADTERYACVYPNETLCDHNTFTTIRDKTTTFIKPYQKDLDIPHGILIDVFPLDGYPDSGFQRKMQIFWALVYSLYCSEMVPQKHGGFLKFCSAAALKLVPSRKLRYKIWRFAEKKMSRYPISECRYITELCAGPGYMMKQYPAEAFASAIRREFEGYLLPIPVGYDAYLSTAFGDYMTPPPPEKQVPQHDALFYDLENSYLKYKGQYYCTEERKGRNS